MKLLSSLLLGCCSVFTIAAQTPTRPDAKITANPEYEVVILESDDAPLVLDAPRDLTKRGLGDDIWKAMRSSMASTITGQVLTTSGDVLASAVGALVEGLRSKKADWYAQATKDCVFVKRLSLPVQTNDFYKSTSTNGALDPDGIVFDGFKCLQYYTYTDDNGAKERVPAFSISCKLRKDEQGQRRILHHGKFEVELEHFYFNPELCNLPNDSLNADNLNLRIPFDFEKRKNLTVTIDTKILSSWMNEAIQIVEDKQLGEFTVSVTIPDASALQEEGPFKGWYAYDPQNRAVTPTGVVPTVKGDCFIVPRSFIGTDDGNVFNRVWGTGEYKLDITLTEKCDVNLDYYYDNTEDASPVARPMNGPMKFGPGKGQKWNHHWTEEWNKMKQRRKSRGFWGNIADRVVVNYANGRWIYIFTEPVTNTLLTHEQAKITPLVANAFSLDTGSGASQKGQQAAQGQQQGAQGQQQAAQGQQQQGAQGQQQAAQGQQQQAAQGQSGKM